MKMPKLIHREDFSEEQELAFQYIVTFIKSNERQMVLRGYSGTGKSSLCNVLLDHFDEKMSLEYTCTAPTNEAVRVISKLTRRQFNKTIYSLLGLALVSEDDGQPTLKRASESKISKYDVAFTQRICDKSICFRKADRKYFPIRYKDRI